MTILKKRKIILWATVFAIILMFLFSFLEGRELHKYTVESKEKYKDLIQVQNENEWIYDVSYTLLITPVVFYGFWFIFAFIYLYTKNKNEVRLRKWPYIVLIVFLSISVIFYFFIIYRRFTSYYTMEKPNNLVSALLQKQLDEDLSNKISIKIFAALSLVFSLVALSLVITNLVLIKKEKAEGDVQYSQTVLETEKNIKNKNAKIANQPRAKDTNKNNLP